MMANDFGIPCDSISVRNRQANLNMERVHQTIGNPHANANMERVHQTIGNILHPFKIKQMN